MSVKQVMHDCKAGNVCKESNACEAGNVCTARHACKAGIMHVCKVTVHRANLFLLQ